MEEDIIMPIINMIKTEASDSNSSNSPPQRAATTSYRPNRPNGLSSSRYKGVVPQQNGHWGAQIYANHHRIWLGTFKTEAAAAAAYDSAAIKLRPGNSGDPHRNFPWTSVTRYEPTFQAHYATDQVLNMIKDGTYQAKLAEFISSITQVSRPPNNNNNSTQIKNEGYFCQEFFRKELTPSDVGKLNRLVIPKRYALKFFPTNEIVGPNQNGQGRDMELIFYDKSMKNWKFRYCYWKSSQSFVFTRGWNKFVKEKELKAKDIVAFYFCELRENNGKDVRKFCMVDVVGCNIGSDQSQNNDGVKLEEGIDYGNGIQKEKALLKGEEATLTNKEEKGFRLFGVHIC